MQFSLSLSLAFTGLVSVCNGLSSNFGHPNEGSHGSSYVNEPSFGDIHIPLGESSDESGNVWSQPAAVDPAMYTRYSQPLPQGSEFPVHYGGHDALQAQGGYFHPSQGYQELQQAYHLPPAQYDLPPTHYDPNVYSNYDPLSQFHGSVPPASPTMSYQSFGQPYGGVPAFTGEGDAGEEPWQDYDGQTMSHPAWTTAATNSTTGGIPALINQNFDLPEHTQAMDRLNLGGLGRVRTDSSDGDAGEEGSTRAEQSTRRRKGKVAAPAGEASRVREPQTARVISSIRRNMGTSAVREPSTARLPYLVKQQERLENRNMVEDEFISRQLSKYMHEQLVAEQVCEIKITHPGQELAIGRIATTIVGEWGDARYTYDFRGWNTVYRHKLSSLRRGFADNGGGTAEQLEWYLLNRFRDIRVSYEGSYADPMQEQQQLTRAAEVWAHFKRMRLRGVIRDDTEVSIPIVAHFVPRFKCGLTSVTDSLTLIKKYLRSILGFSYLDIQQLEALLPQSRSEQAQDG